MDNDHTEVTRQGLHKTEGKRMPTLGSRYGKIGKK